MSARKVNATCEAIAAVLSWHSCWLVYQRPPAGISPLAIGFSALWGLAAVGYYLEHKDPLSAAGAIVRTAGNFTWVVIALRAGAMA